MGRKRVQNVWAAPGHVQHPGYIFPVPEHSGICGFLSLVREPLEKLSATLTSVETVEWLSQVHVSVDFSRSRTRAKDAHARSHEGG